MFVACVEEVGSRPDEKSTGLLIGLLVLGASVERSWTYNIFTRYMI